MRCSIRAPGISADTGLAILGVGAFADLAERLPRRCSMRAPGIATSTAGTGFTGGTGSSG